jgi:hypothetical protein
VVTTGDTSPFVCPDAGEGEHDAEGPHSLTGTGVFRAAKDAAQALGLRPWLAALPLRERRLRARLLMCAPNGVVSDPNGAAIGPSVSYYRQRGFDLEFVRGRPDQKADHGSAWRHASHRPVSSIPR